MIRIAVQASSVEAGSSLIDHGNNGEDTCIYVAHASIMGRMVSRENDMTSEDWLV